MKRPRHIQRGPANDHPDPRTRDSKTQRLNKEGRRKLAFKRVIERELREDFELAGALNYFRLSS